MANEVKNISPMKLTLLVTIVPRDKEGFFIDYLQTLGSNLQMSAAGHGTATKEVLEYLGLDNNDKSVIFSVIRSEKTERFLTGLEDKFTAIRDAKGIAAAIPLSSVIGRLSFGFLSGDSRVVKGEN
ncbi:MAG: hypothetical protein IKG97_06565 [Lachnospiraceae bacterium]|nr:hypothetical protein [Lachnospiraceae bacterium]